MRKFLILFAILFLFCSNLYADKYFKILLRAAFKNNYIIKSYKNYVKSVKEDIDISIGSFFPKIDISYNFTGTTEPGQAAFFKTKQGKFTMSYYLKYMNDPPFVKEHQILATLIQPIFSKGQIYLSKKQAELNCEAAVKSFEQVKREIKFKVFTIIINANKLIENILINKNIKKKAETYFKVIKNHYQNGTVLKSDYLYADYHLKQAIIAYKNSRNNIFKIKSVLMQITGKNFKVKQVYFPVKKSLDIENLIKYGLSHREDIIVAKKYLEIAKIELEKKRNQFLPEVYGYANYERNSEKFTSLDKDGYSVGVGVKLNIFNDFRDKNSIEKAKFNALRLENFLKDKEETLKREIKDAYIDYQNARLIYNTMKGLVKSNKIALEIIEKRFKEGLERITTLVDMETNYKNSLNQLAESKYDMVFKYYTILSKAGKF